MSTDPYGQYWSPYMAMGNSPIMGVDPDGGLFGEIRAAAYAFWGYLNGYKSGFFRSETNGYWYGWYGGNSKNFGNGGLGRLKSIDGSEIEFGGSVDLGLLSYIRDSGVKGLRISGPSIRLLEAKYSNVNLEGKSDLYIIGQDGKFKGSIFEGQIETGVWDAGLAYKYEIDLKSKDRLMFIEEYSLGRPLLQTDLKHVIGEPDGVLKGGMYEDIGHSINICKGLSINLKGWALSKSKFSWEF